MLTPLAVAALGLLRERPMHPYEMHQLLLARHRDEFVKVRAGSLYHAIERLERDGLVAVAGTEREGNRPERTTYRLTDAGSAEIEAWVNAQLSTPARDFPAYPFALAEAHNLTPDQAHAALTRRVDALTAEIARLEQIVASRPATPDIYLIGADYTLTMLHAQVDWTRELASRIENKDFPWQPLP